MNSIRNYPLKDRIGPLVAASFLPWLAFRPAYWPFLSIGDSDSVFFLDFLNRMTWAVIGLGAIVIVDCLAVQTMTRKKSDADEQAKVALPHVFWSGLSATLLTKTFIDFAFAGRPLPLGSEQWFAYERWFDIIALGALPFVYLVARRIGPPSNWPIVQALVLRPTTTQEQR